jgi:hypothetical protein
MRIQLHSAVTTVALLATVGAAAAATSSSTMKSANDMLNLTSTQRHEIYQDVGKQKMSQTAPAGFTAKLGEAVPSSVRLNPLPASATKQVSAVKSYDYAKLGNEVLIVNPSSKKIADVIQR